MNRDPVQARATGVTALALLLAACSCGAIYQGWSWLATAFITIAVAAVGSMFCRWTRIPLLLQPPVVGAFLLVWTTARFASEQAIAGLIPTSASWHELTQKYSYGIHDLTATTAPIPSNDNSLLVLVAGLGLMALAADLLSVGAQRPSLAGLPMLAVVVVAAAIRHGGIGLLPFLLAASGYLLLLSLDSRDRVARWGRVLPPRSPRPADDGGGGSGSGSIVWRIGTATLGLALLVPIAIPGGNHSRLGGSGGIGSGGSSSTTVINPLSTIQSQLQSTDTFTLLQVRTTTPTYQRLTALDNFDSNGFTLVPLSANRDDKVASGGLSQVFRPPNAQNIRETISADDRLDQAFLPIPQNPSSIAVQGDWRLSAPTGTVFSSRTTTMGKTWTVVGAIPTPTVPELEAAGSPETARTLYPSTVRAADLSVPDNLPPIVEATARKWVAAAKATTTYEIANAIQSNFTGGTFTYDVNVNIAAGAAGFRQFLTDRRGYCQQYATTMAAMLRTLGIPARVAIGFTAGTLQPDGTYKITNRDAHAWPEVWFNNIGWVRFEPTPLDNGNALVPNYTSTSTDPGNNGQNPTTTPTTQPSADAGTDPTTGPDKQSLTDGDALAASRTSGSARNLVLGVLAGVLALAIGSIPWLVRRWRRRARWRFAVESRPELVDRRAAEAAWADVLDDALDRGVPIPRSASPRQVGRHLRAALSPTPTVGEPAANGQLGEPSEQISSRIDLLVSAIERARYGTAAAHSGVPSADDIRRAADLVSAGLVERQEGRQRLVATLFPPSTRRFWITPLRDGARIVARTIDLAIARADELIRRRPVPSKGQ